MLFYIENDIIKSTKLRGSDFVQKTLNEKSRKELERLNKQLAKPKSRGYLAYFMFVIAVIYMADEIASQIGIQMQTVIASQIFAPVFGADVAVARMSAFGTVATIGSVVAFIYKPLSDKFGRKKFLVINTLGLGIAMFIVFLSDNIPLYVIGTCMIQFFVPHDMQVVYIMESVPSKHRARIYFAIKSFATMGIMLVPVLRRTLMTDMSQWRLVFLVPAVIGLVTSLVALLFARETDAFIESKLRFSDKPAFAST